MIGETQPLFWVGGSTFPLEGLVSVTTSSVSTWDVKREAGRELIPANAWIFADVNGRVPNSGSAEMEKPDTQRPRPGVPGHIARLTPGNAGHGASDLTALSALLFPGC